MKFLLYNFTPDDIDKMSHLVVSDNILEEFDNNNFIFDSDTNTLSDSKNQPYHLIVDSVETFLDYISQFSLIGNK